jgi:hypothetical protein
MQEFGVLWNLHHYYKALALLYNNVKRSGSDLFEDVLENALAFVS